MEQGPDKANMYVTDWILWEADGPYALTHRCSNPSKGPGEELSPHLPQLLPWLAFSPLLLVHPNLLFFLQLGSKSPYMPVDAKRD